MAFDKVKTLRVAERFLETGKIPAAIKEYSKIIENEPEDFTTLNILGDLHVRTGNQAAAISCFRRIAEHYRDQDFAFKAIAMFKKIDRLQPGNIEIASHLADLYAQQDLVIEARTHYLIVANAHAQAGATQAGLEVLRKIADLDPQNTEVRIKLAEGFLHEGMSKEAATSFTEAGQNLLARGSLDEALEVLGKSLRIEPADRETLKGLLDTHVARGTAYEAAEIVASASRANPDDIDLLSLLARAYLEAEDPEQAEAVIALLIAKDGSLYLRLIEVARLYLQTDKIEEAIRVVAGMAEQMMSEREENQLLEIVDELLTSDSDNVEALRLLVRAHWWQRDIENLKAALERLAEAAQAAGLEKDERYALTQLTRLSPELTHYVERLNELGGAEEDAAAEALPEFEAAAEAQAVSSDYESASDMKEHSLADGETEFEWNAVADMAELRTEAPAQDMELERGFTFEAVVAEELASSSDSATEANADDEDRHAMIRAQELESVDFYIAQGYTDIAVDTLDLLERQFGEHADIRRRRQQLKNLAAGGSLPKDSEPTFEFNVSTPKPEHSPAVAITEASSASGKAAPAQVIDPGLAEIFEEYRVSAEAETKGNGDYETHYNLGLAYQEMDLFEEALEEFQIAIGLVSPDDGTPRYLQCCNLLGHCFMQKGVPQLAVKWFIQGLGAPNTSDDERQALRFDLAAAYERAGDLDRAKDLFTEIYGVNVSYRGVNERLKALEMRMA
ncbi:MAG TPA: tetratricopeptide repeat protein [Pyrinomonadaceae bacterium]|nr:tetratricopeptide repeat protein [Pyrinomonadaceae bacterium]